MKKLFLLTIFFIITQCSFNKNEKELINIINAPDNILLLSINEYQLYIDEHTKKSKYPRLINE